MFNGDWFDKAIEPDREDLVGYQIMMHYCWKHDESTLYLCPYGAGVNYVNHGSSDDNDNDTKTTANVRLQWAADGVMGHNASWLNKPPAAMGPCPPVSLNFGTRGNFARRDSDGLRACMEKCVARARGTLEEYGLQ
jgi:hypothetical protein